MEHKLTFKDYNAALKENRLRGMKCGSCGNVMAQARLACSKCGSTDLIVVDLKGAGVIQSFTVMYVAPEGREAELPYIIVLVELEEGPWVMGNLSGIAPELVTMKEIGRRVSMASSRIFAGDKYSAGEIARPVFELVS